MPAAALTLNPIKANADSIEDIAARNNKLAQQQRDEQANKQEPEGDGGKSLVPIALGASVALSLPFYWKNVARLGIKLSGGGDGYDKIR